MTLVKRFLESEYNNSLTRKFRDFFRSQYDIAERITKLESSDTDGTLVSFDAKTFTDTIMKEALEAVNKELAKEGTEAYILNTDYHNGTNYDIEEREIKYETMTHGTIDFSGGWDTHYRFEKSTFGVKLPNGKKAVYIKTKVLKNELSDNGIGQMRGHYDTWLYEPASNDSSDGYFIVQKDVLHPVAGEDCIATWYSGKYGDDNSVSADDYFKDTIDSQNAPMNDEEKSAIKKVLHFFIQQYNFPVDIFGDGFGHYSEEEVFTTFYKDESFETSLECIAEAINIYFDENPEAKETYGAYSNDGEYLPFTVKDIYEIDDETGLFELPSED